jgi:hypothetical protein
MRLLGFLHSLVQRQNADCRISERQNVDFQFATVKMSKSHTYVVIYPKLTLYYLAIALHLRRASR